MHPQNVIPEEDQPEMVERLAKGNFTMRTMYEQFQNLTKMGPMSQASTPLGPPANLVACPVTQSFTPTPIHLRTLAP